MRVEPGDVNIRASVLRLLTDLERFILGDLGGELETLSGLKELGFRYLPVSRWRNVKNPSIPASF